MSSITETEGGILYEMINLVNGKGYAGRDSNPKLVDGVWKARRPAQHIASARRDENDCPLLNNAIRKNERLYGKPMFLVISHPDWHHNDDVLNDEEKKLIRVREYFTDRSKGYNLTKGGEGVPGWIPSQETRNKLSAWQLGKPKSTESVFKRKLSQCAFRDSNIERVMEMLSNGKSQKEVAKEIGVSRLTILNWKKFYRLKFPERCIAIRGVKTSRAKGKPKSPNWFAKKRSNYNTNIDIVLDLLSNGKSVRSVAKEIGVAHQTIYRWVKFHKRHHNDVL